MVQFLLSVGYFLVLPTVVFPRQHDRFNKAAAARSSHQRFMPRALTDLGNVLYGAWVVARVSEYPIRRKGDHTLHEHCVIIFGRPKRDLRGMYAAVAKTRFLRDEHAESTSTNYRIQIFFWGGIRALIRALITPQ